MNNQNKIKEKQNDDELLKCQFAARTYYNRAEVAGYVSWSLALIGAVLILIPYRFSVVLLILSIIIDLLALILHYIVEQNVKSGAQMRNFYDAKVLDICNYYSSSEEHTIWEKANSIVNANKDAFTYQSTHTGKDSPPGLRNWYVFPKSYSTSESAVFECQKQNYWWTEKLYKKRIIAYIFSSAILIVLAGIGVRFSLLKTVLCLISFVIKLYVDIRNCIHCSKTMQSIQTITEFQNEAITLDIIETLQKHIIERRKIQLLEINRIHRKNAAKWSNLYEICSVDNDTH